MVLSVEEDGEEEQEKLERRHGGGSRPRRGLGCRGIAGACVRILGFGAVMQSTEVG